MKHFFSSTQTQSRKNKNILPLAIASFFISAFAHAAPTVIQSANFNGSTYHLLSESLWSEAEAYAQSLGGHLATIETLNENNFLFTTFGPTVGGLSSSGKASMWIGLNDAVTEGQYVWSSGSTSAFRNWNSGQPQNHYVDEDYIAILVENFGTAGKWHDVVSDKRLGDVTFGIVELQAVPAPATFWLFGSGIAGLLGLKRRKIT